MLTKKKTAAKAARADWTQVDRGPVRGESDGADESHGCDLGVSQLAQHGDDGALEQRRPAHEDAHTRRDQLAERGLAEVANGPAENNNHSMHGAWMRDAPKARRARRKALLDRSRSTE